MAESLVDGEFWLPPKFLNDDDMFLEEKRGVGNGLLYPFEFPLGSPVESLVGSSETESDEDEYIAGLTTQMARSGLHNSHGWGSSGSPQSTLCGCKQGSSSRGSPNGHFPQHTLDLLYAAAGEVSKMGINENAYRFVNSRRPLAPPLKPEPDAAVYQQLQATQFLHLRKQLLIEQMKSAALMGQSKGSSVRHPQPQMPQNGGRNCEFFKPNWAPPRKHTPPNGSGMRAVFLGAPGGKRECTGTGVFLPRQVGKKPACSTVLVPARVMQALNLNVDDMYVQQRVQTRSPPVFNSENNDVSVRIRNENLAAQQKANLRVTVPPLSHEIRLPHEWAY